MFLLLLLVNKNWGMFLVEVFMSRRDGLQPEELLQRCTWLQKLRPPFLNLITLPTWLAAKGENVGEPAPIANEEKAQFIVGALLKRLRASLRDLKPRARKTGGWSNYMDSHSYDQQTFTTKKKFI